MSHSCCFQATQISFQKPQFLSKARQFLFIHSHTWWYFRPTEDHVQPTKPLNIPAEAKQGVATFMFQQFSCTYKQ